MVGFYDLESGFLKMYIENTNMKTLTIVYKQTSKTLVLEKVGPFFLENALLNLEILYRLERQNLKICVPRRVITFS